MSFFANHGNERMSQAMVAQFGIPGLGVASALSKLTKLQQLGSFAAIDAAVRKFGHH